MKKILTKVVATALLLVCGLMPTLAQQVKLQAQMDVQASPLPTSELLKANAGSVASSVAASPAKVSSCVTNPTGEHHRYSLYCYSVEDAKTTIIDGLVADIYFDGTDVYVRNLVYSGNDDSYAVGKLAEGDATNGVITFDNGVEYAKGKYAYIGTMDSDGWLVPDTVAESFSYQITDGVITAVGPEATYNQAYIMGYNQYGSLAGYVVMSTYTPVDLSIGNIAVPSNVELKDYVMACDPYSSNDVGAKSIVKVGFDGNDVYVKEIISGAEQSVIKGVANATDSTVTFPTGIFGIVGNAYVSLYPATLNVTGYNVRVTLNSSETAVTMKYDPDSKTMKCNTPIVVIAGKQTIVAVYNNPEFKEFAHEFVSVPEGLEFTNYAMRSTGAFYDDPADNSYSYKITKVSQQVDGDVYFGGVGGDDSFAFKGKLDANSGKIKVEMPQYLGKTESGQVVYVCTAEHKMNTSSWPSYDYFVANDTTATLYFDYDEATGTITYSEGSICAMVFGSDDALTSMANPVWTPFPYEKTVMPDGVETKLYSLASDNNYSYQRRYDIQSSLVKVAKEGNDCYICGWDVDNDRVATLHGTLSDGKLTIKLPQYVSDAESVMLACAGDYVEQGNCPTIESTELVFDYDADKEQFVLDGTVKIINLLGSDIYYFNNPTITLYDPQVGARPATPTPDLEDIYDDGRWNYIQRCTTAWQFKDYDTEGNFLSTDSMTYSVYVDGELYTFSPSVYYEEFTAPTTEVPMTLASSNFSVYRNTRLIALAVKPEKTVGVQAHFYLNGQKTSSDIATYDIVAGAMVDAISSAAIADQGVREVEYYDVSGAKLAAKPSRGFFIKRTTYADGTTKIFKSVTK